MITKKTIDEIFNTARVEEVIGDFIQLKKAGSNYKGLSPFSNEKSPSFVVSPAKQIWKDFSSGKGGTVVNFLMEHEQYNYPEALKWLAKRYNIEIEEDRVRSDLEIQKAQERESIYTVTEFGKNFFKKQLWDTDEGKSIALSYFKERGFTKPIIDLFELGYSPQQADAFSSFAVKSGYTFDQLNKAGLSVGNESQPFDRFRERVMFPIHSFSGRTLGFGARILGNNKKTAKYLNSPENEIYHKSKILYGIFQSKKEIIRQDQCYLVEGYTDVLSMHQSGIENVIASSGTSLTEEQIRLVKRLTSNLTVLYDGDSAGIKASFRGIDLILEQEMNVKVVLLPEGEDPDSFAKSHSEEELKAFFKDNTKDFVDFKIHVLDASNKDPIHQSKIIKSITDSIARIPNRLQREFYVQKTASLLNIREELLFVELTKAGAKVEEELIRTQIRNDRNSKKDDSSNSEEDSNSNLFISPFAFLEEEMISTMLRFGKNEIEIPIENSEETYTTTVMEEIIDQLEEDKIHFSTPFYQDMFVEMQQGLKNDEHRVGDFFMQSPDQGVSTKASSLLIDKYTLSDKWIERGVYTVQMHENLNKKIQDMVYNYKRITIEELIRAKTRLLKDASEDNEKRTAYLTEIIQLTGIKNQIERLLNRTV